jgi:hypothetical protein
MILDRAIVFYDQRDQKIHVAGKTLLDASEHKVTPREKAFRESFATLVWPKLRSLATLL